MPTTCAPSVSWATARMAIPGFVICKKSSSTAMVSTAATKMTMSWTLTTKPPRLTVPCASGGSCLRNGPKMIRSALSMINAIPRVAITTSVSHSFCTRTGRMRKRSAAIPKANITATTIGTTSG